MSVPRNNLRFTLRRLYDWLDENVGGAASVAWGSITGKPDTFPPTIGNTATTAMAGNTPIPDEATWANLSGKPAVIAAGADQAAARAAIGAGTSNVTVGTAAANAAPGTLVADVADLEARVAALEAAVE